MQLRIYAKYSESDSKILPDGFEARVVAAEKRYQIFVDGKGVKLFFSLIFAFPCITLLLSYFYAKGARLYTRDILSNPQYHSRLAALFTMGQMFTLFVAIMDALSISFPGCECIANGYMKNMILALCIMEFTVFAFTCVVFVTLGCVFCCKKRNDDENVAQVFRMFYKLVFCTSSINISPNEAKLWFVTLGLIPPLLTLSSHIGFIIAGWISSHNQGLPIFLLYMFVGIFFFFSFQQTYSFFSDWKELYAVKKKRNNTRQKNEGIDEVDYEKGIRTKKEKKGLDFRILLGEIVSGILVLGIVVYLGSTFTQLPILQVTDDIVTYTYQLGQYALVFAVFFLTYKSTQKQDSSGIVPKGSLKFWRRLYKKTQDANVDSEGEIKVNANVEDSDMAREYECQIKVNENPGGTKVSVVDKHVISDADKTDALAAVLIFKLMKLNDNDPECCKELLKQIVE